MNKQSSGREYEKELEKNGYKKVKGSGNTDHKKGDLENENYLIEAKCTHFGSYRLTKPIWNKIKKEANAIGKEPMMFININGVELAVLERSMLEYLMES